MICLTRPTAPCTPGTTSMSAQPPAASEPAPPAEETIIIGAGLDLENPDSPLAPYFCRPGAVAAAVFFGLLFLLINHLPVNHTDVWGHLAYGRWIVEHKALPTEDPFCRFAEPQGQ